MSGGANDDRVGYGRPPKSKRWTKGQSGNPRGRPKGSRSFAEILNEQIRKKVKITDGGQVRSVTIREAMAMRLAQLVLKGPPALLPRLLKEIERHALPEAKAQQPQVGYAVFPDEFLAVWTDEEIDTVTRILAKVTERIGSPSEATVESPSSDDDDVENDVYDPEQDR